jgi:hypothetical protein
VPRFRSLIPAISVMRTIFTPPAMAAVAAVSFALMPPEARPSCTSPLASATVSVAYVSPSTITPGTSLTMSSSDASIAIAIAAAASSALTLSAGPSSWPTFRLTGEITGR